MVKGFKYYFWFWLHVLIIINVFTSPFWIPFPYILFGTIVYYLGKSVIGYCPLTKWQLGSTKHTFLYTYLNKLGIAVDETRVRKVTSILPLLLIAVGFWWQLGR